MKSFSKIVLASAFAVSMMAVSAVPSEAARHHKRMKAPAPCTPGMLCTLPTKNVQVCGGDQVWHQALFTPVCVGPVCPASCM